LSFVPVQRLGVGLVSIFCSLLTFSNHSVDTALENNKHYNWRRGIWLFLPVFNPSYGTWLGRWLVHFKEATLGLGYHGFIHNIE
jgi:hypothetical protein